MEANQRTNETYTIAWVCALPIEQAAAQAMLDERHPNLPAAQDDTNNYRFGRIGEHNVVIAVLRSAGTTPAAVSATNLLRSFPRIRFSLMVGVGGGAPGKPHRDPQKDIRLGDIVVSNPSGGYGGVVQYDLGKSLQEGKFIRTGSLNAPPTILGTAVAGLRGDAQLYGYQIQPLVEELIHKYPEAGFDYPGDEADKLFAADYTHIQDAEDDEDECILCEITGLLERKHRKNSKAPAVHYGLVGSANQVLRNSKLRDDLRRELGIICFEMEAGGLMNDFPCLVIRGICGYCDSHKNKQWQPYAAITAAAYSKRLLSVIAPEKVAEEKLAQEVSSIFKVQTIALGQLGGSLAKVDAKLDLRNLPNVPNAAFDSHEDFDEQDSTCLLGTRTDILQKIRIWISEATDKPIFWLNGMAGTGKSTIARSVAQEFAHREQLGASFFFKKGEGDRQSCRYFFTTIAFQLAQSLPILRQHIAATIEETPDIGHKALKEQFDRLILSPFRANVSKLNAPIVFIVDALDECIDQDKIHIIISLLSEFRTIGSQNVRVLLTSRREQVLDRSFSEITTDIFDDIILHEITETTIQRDISRYLEYKFDQIRDRNQHELSTDWPGHGVLKHLTDMSSPLFIFAATICRFIGDRRSDPVGRLRSVLDRKRTNQNKLQQMYQPILEALLEVLSEEEASILHDFRSIVGTIVVLIEPLTATSLSRLLKIESSRVSSLLRQLHSVLRISSDHDTPVRTLHASFSDYLLHPSEKHCFEVDAYEIHGQIALRCLSILQHSDCLSRGDICGLKDPAFAREDIDTSLVYGKIMPEVRYACCYWIHHLREGLSSLPPAVVEGQVLTFLETRFVFWFEALSLLGRAYEAVFMLSDLSSLCTSSMNSTLKAAIYDARRFVMANSHIADMAPLQLYSSCLTFFPTHSMPRADLLLATWLKHTPIVPKKWGALLQTLDTGQKDITALKISPDDKLLASASSEGTIQLRNASSGQLQQTLKCSEGVSSIAFSPDSRSLASGSHDGAVLLWCLSLGQSQQIINSLAGHIMSLSFTNDGKLLAYSGSDHIIKLWDIVSGELQQVFEGHSGAVTTLFFLPNNSDLLVSSSWDDTIKFWDVASSLAHYTIEDYLGQSNTMALSPDGNILAYALNAFIINVWHVASNKLQYDFVGHKGATSSIAFSPNGNLLTCGATDGKTKLWYLDKEGPLLLRSFNTDTDACKMIFYSDSTTLASSSSSSNAIQLWHLDPGEETNELAKEHRRCVTSLAFSPNGKMLASASKDYSVKLYMVNSTQIKLREGYEGDAPYIPRSIAFSPNGQLLAYALTASTIEIKSLGTDPNPRLLEGTIGDTASLAFSSDSRLLVAHKDCYSSREDYIELSVWSAESPRRFPLQTHRIQHSYTPAATWSDGKLWICYNEFESQIEIWNPNPRRLKQRIKTPGIVNRLLYDNELSMLQTNLGSINIGEAAADTRLTWNNLSRLDIEGNWIISYGQKVLWLPPEYQDCVFACHGDLMALGLKSGRIVLLEIATEELDFISNKYGTLRCSLEVRP